MSRPGAPARHGLMVAPNVGSTLSISRMEFLLSAIVPTVADWSLLSTHGLVLVNVARHPEARLRDIADWVGLTERAVQRIVGDLCEAGYLCRRRVGRRNAYEIRPGLPLRHPSLQDRRLSDLLAGLVELPASEGLVSS